MDMGQFVKVFLTIFGIGLLCSLVPWGPLGLMAGAQSVFMASLMCTVLYFRKTKRQRKVVPIPNRQFYVLIGLCVLMYLTTTAWMWKEAL